MKDEIKKLLEEYDQICKGFAQDCHHKGSRSNTKHWTDKRKEIQQALLEADQPKCETCKGSEHVPVQVMPHGDIDFTRCPNCQPADKGKPCTECGGSKKIFPGIHPDSRGREDCPRCKSTGIEPDGKRFKEECITCDHMVEGQKGEAVCNVGECMYLCKETYYKAMEEIAHLKAQNHSLSARHSVITSTCKRLDARIQELNTGLIDRDTIIFKKGRRNQELESENIDHKRVQYENRKYFNESCQEYINRIAELEENKKFILKVCPRKVKEVEEIETNRYIDIAFMPRGID